MTDEEERTLIAQEDARLEAGLKGLALFVFLALIMVGAALLIMFVGF